MLSYILDTIPSTTVALRINDFVYIMQKMNEIILEQTPDKQTLIMSRHDGKIHILSPTKKTQDVKVTLVQYLSSTPFPKNRYQIIATFWERCRYFCKKSAILCIFHNINYFFSILHKRYAIFAYIIRAPPSEV